MPHVLLYHGSETVVVRPRCGAGRRHNDYGPGFYCTEDAELACEWACRGEGRDGYVNAYRFDTEGLRFLNLSDGAYCALHWLALLLANRLFDVKTPVAQAGRDYLLGKFLVDTEPYDAIVGWRADDSYFSFARAFLSNSISYEQLSCSMRLGNLGEQVVAKSPLAFERLEFVGAEPVPSSIYYPKRLSRDEQARANYQAEARRQGITGLFLRDIVLADMEEDDERLR